MDTRLKRFLSLALTLIMVISMVPTTAFATETNECAHEFGEAVVVDVKATCEAAGSGTKTCSLCGATEPVVIDALGHTWSETHVTTEATCEVAGAGTQTCGTCGTTQDVVVEATGHNYVDGTCACGATETPAQTEQTEAPEETPALSEEPIALIDEDATQPDGVINSEVELKAALEAGGTVTLGGNIAVTAEIQIPAGVTVTLDLAGYAITSAFQSGSNSKHIYPIRNNGVLTIQDSVGTGAITGRGIYNGVDGADNTGAKLTVNGAKIVAEDWNGGAGIWSYGGEVYLNNATIIGNTGVVYSKGYLEINGGTYTCYSGIKDDGTQATSPTYNIRAYNGLKITDGTFTSRHGVISLGGGEGLIEDGSYTIQFAAATTSNVVYVYGDAKLTIKDGAFISDNSANKADSGAAVLVSGDSACLNIDNGTFVGMNGMVSINANTVINGGSFDTVWNYNHYGSIESAVATGATVTVAGKKLVKTETGMEEYKEPVAKIGEQGYTTLAEALAAANDGATIELISGNNVISMAGSVVGGKTITITGTAIVDWTKGNLYVGRGGEGDGKVIFDGANITSSVKQNIASTGIHVSGSTASDANVNNGVLVIKDSNIELDYLINRNEVVVEGNSMLTIYGGHYTHGRDANESASGNNETASLTIESGSTVNVKNENGMGIGGESNGVMTVKGTYIANVLNISSIGEVIVDGGSLAVDGNVTNKGKLTINNSELTDAAITGTGVTYFNGNISFNGANSVTTTVDGGPFEMVVNKGATLLISRFTLGYNRNITVYGEIEDADNFVPTGKTPSLKFNSTSGVSVGGTGTGNLTVKDAYVELDSSSWKYASGTYDWSFENSYVSATSFTNNTARGSEEAVWTVTFDDSVLMAKNYIKNGVGTTYNFTNGSKATTGSLRIDGVLNIDETSSVTTTLQQNNKVGALDEHGGINGTVNVKGTLTIGSNAKTQLEVLGGELNVEGGKVALGNNTLTLDAASKLTIDVTGMNAGEVNSIEGAVTNNGTLEIKGNDLLKAEVVDGKVVLVERNLAGEGTEANPYLINNLEDLKLFRDKVNAGDTYSGKYVKLNADIDLDQEDWIPITKFNGTFDGDNHVISNLWVVGDGNQGFFAQVADQTEYVSGTVKNVTFENATIISSNDSAAVIATAHLGARINNVKLIGEVTIQGYRGVAGIVGNGFPVMDGCSVEAEGTITATYWGVGGILGFASDKGAKVSNSTIVATGSGLTIRGELGGVGAVTGTPHGAATNGATVSGVELTSNNNYYMAYIDASGTVKGDITVEDVVVKVNGEEIIGKDAIACVGTDPYFDIQEAIKAAAPAGTVELLSDVTVDKWIMISETLTIGDGTVITLDLNGLTIDGNGHTLTIKDVESANNGGHIFYDGDYNVCDLTLDMGANVNGLGITSGTISNVTFIGGRGASGGAAIHVNDALVAGVHAGNVTVEGCTFKNNGGAIYYETAQNGLVVNNNTFEVPSGANVILMRGTETFTNNTVVSGRTVNVVSGSPVVSGNDFGDVRLKVYNEATATISNNTINKLEFSKPNEVAQATFSGNTLSAAAQAALDAVAPVAKVGNTGYATLQEAFKAAQSGGTIEILSDITIDEDWDCRNYGSTADYGTFANPVTINGNGHTIKFTGKISDGFNNLAAFRFDNTATVNGLIIDMSEAVAVFQNRFSAIVARGDLTVENCKFIGSTTYTSARAIIFGEGLQTPGVLDVTVTGSEFTNWKFGIVDDMNGKDTASELTVQGNTFTNANVNVSADEKVTFTGNTVADGSYVKITAYSGLVDVTANGNAMSEHTETSVSNAVNFDNVQGEFQIIAPVTVTSDGVTKRYATLQAAIDAAEAGDTVTLIDNITLTKGVTVPAGKAITLDLNGKTISGTHGAEYAMIHINNGADVTINDTVGGGKITCAAGGNNVGATIWNEGSLTLKAGTIENTGDWTLGFVVDLRPNAWGSAHTAPASFVMNGGKLASTDTAIRVASNSSDAYQELGVNFTMNGGTIESTHDAIFVQHLYAGDLNINVVDGTVTGENSVMRIYGNAGSDVDMIVTGGAFNGPIKVADAYADTDAIAVSGGTFSTDVQDFVADGFTADPVRENGKIVYKVKAIPVAELNRVEYTSLQAAINDAQDGDTVYLLSDVILTETIVIDKAIRLYGENNTLTSSAARAINVTGADANGVVIKDLIINASGERAVNVIQNATNVTLDNVTATAGNYALNIAASAPGAVATIKNSDLTGLSVVNLASAGAQVTINNTNLTSNDTAESENYGVITVGLDATNAMVAMTGGSVTATGDSFGAAVFGIDGDVTFTNTAGEPEVRYVVAMIDGAGLFDLASAFAYAGQLKGDVTIDLIRDVEQTKNAAVPAGAKITLNLNGKTITGTDNSTGNFGLIDMQPGSDLTINGDGAITLSATNDRGWNAYSSVISNQRGTLTVNGGTIEHLGGTDMAYAIDVLTNTGAQKAETIINGGTIKSTYRAIRQFLNSSAAGVNNILTVNGGTIEGANKSIWMQDANTNANPGTLTVGEDATLKGDVYLFVAAGSAEWPVTVSIDADALADGSEVLTGNVPAGYEVANVGDTYGVFSGVAKIGTTYYATLTAAMAAAQAGDTIALLKDVTASEVILIDKNLTIDGNGHEVTSSASRVFRVTTSDVEVTLDGVNVVSTAVRVGTNDVRGIAIDPALQNVELTLDNCSVDFTDASANDWAYAVNVAGNGTGHTVTINGGSYEGANVINVYGANNTVTVKNATLNSTYPDNDQYFGACIYVKQDQNSTVNATGNTFNGTNAMAINAGYTPVTESNNTDNTTMCVAKIGDTYYTDLHAAMVAAKSGETVKMLQNVDLAGTEWEPVSFKGTFDGQGHTISNLTINKPGVSNTGFITSLNGSFKNVTFTNPTVTGGENTGVVAGRAGGSSALAENITVNGTIKVETTHSGYARAGVIVGGWAYGNYKDITVDGGDKDVSYIKHTGGGDGRYVGGIVGHADDVNSYVKCTVRNITISGAWLCGGIAGPGPADGVASECVVDNINMNADYSGGMFGWYFGNGTIKDGAVKNVAFTDGTSNNGAIGGYGYNESATVTNVTIENIYNGGKALLEHVAEVNGAYFFELQAAIDAADGETVKLLRSETLNEGVTVPAGKTITLDLNGKTVSMVETGMITASQALITNQGTLTVTDLVGTGKLSYKFDGTPDRQWAYAVATISNQQGTLNIEGGTIESLSLSTNSKDESTYVYKFTIDNLTNGNGGDATVNISGGTITAAKGGSVRGFANSTTCTNTINITDGNIKGQVWMQDPSAQANKGTMSITGGKITANAEGVDAIYFYTDTAGNFELNVSGEVVVDGSVELTDANGVAIKAVTGGTFTDEGVVDYLAEGYSLKYDGEWYTVVPDNVINGVAAIGTKVYATLAEAINDATAGQNINIIGAIKTKPNVTIDKVLNIVNAGGYNLWDAASTKVAIEGLLAEGMIVTDVMDMGIIFSITGEPVEKDPVAKIGETEYTTVEAALQKAQPGETVVMIADSNESDVDLLLRGAKVNGEEKGVILDLAGYKLTANGVTANRGASVVDSSSAKTGLLIVPQGSLALRVNNMELPIWNESNGYFFVTPLSKNQYFDANNCSEEKFRVVFRPDMGTVNGVAVRNAYLNTNGGVDNELTMKVRLSWEKIDANGDTKIVEQYFTYSDALFKGGFKTAFDLMVTGISAIDAITFEYVLVSDTGVEFVGDPITYQK